MSTFNFYNPEYHKGSLPVRVLPYDLDEWFFKVTPEFKNEFDYEVNSNNLKECLTINIIQDRITDVAYIGQNEIVMFENFNQFLWSICYATYVMFDEGIQRPSIDNIFKGSVDFSNPIVKRAYELFNHSFSLFVCFNSEKFFHLPNPEKYDSREKFFIENTNGIYLAALSYILLHEFGHKYFGHTEYHPTSEESKQDEYCADDYAFNKVSYHFDKRKGTTYKLGIIMGLGGLIFLDESLQGGEFHPDPDKRLTRQIEKMELDDINSLWGIASVLIFLWGKRYNKEVSNSFQFENYKEMFYNCLNEIQKYK